jgi:hypothetical protein
LEGRGTCTIPWKPGTTDFGFWIDEEWHRRTRIEAAGTLAAQSEIENPKSKIGSGLP